MDKSLLKLNESEELYCTLCNSNDLIMEFKSGYICKECIEYVKRSEFKSDITEEAKVREKINIG